MRQKAIVFISLPIILTILFGAIINDLTAYSFWMDEGYSAWLVQDVMRNPETPRESLRFVRDSLLNAFNHIQSDVHPPLYYLLLDVWTLLIGHSEFSLRYPSALLGMIALSGIFAIAKRWFNFRTGMIALLLLGTSGFFLYYAREARMYSLYLALSILTIWMYSRWWHRQTIVHTLLFSLMMTLTLFTHYTSVMVVGAIGLHALITIRRWQSAKSWGYLFLAYALTLGIFALWMPFFLRQFDINTGFTAPGSIAGDWGTVAAIWLKLTNGYAWLYLVAIIVSANLLNLHKNSSAILLVLLWGLIPIIGLFTLNAYGLSVLQLRYLIPIIGAWAILVAYFVADIRVPFVNNQTLDTALVILLTGAIVVTQWISYPMQWVAKSDWRGTVIDASEIRQTAEPALVYLDLRSPLAYYAEQTGLLDGVSIIVSWREFTPQEIWNIANSLDNQTTTWGIVAMQAPESWDVIASLSENRGIAYRDSIQASVFYQFDKNISDNFSFSFGTSGDMRLFDYQDDFYTRYQADVADEICTTVNLEALTEINDQYAINVSLTRGYNEVISQIDDPLSSYQTGDTINREFCFVKPDEDDFHLRLSIYDRTTLASLFLLEADEYWGSYLMLGSVEQRPENTP